MIMAGGSGKRLWPASRQNQPKQLINLIQGRSLLSLAVDRLEGLFEPSRILIVTGEAYADQIRRRFPLIPPENVVGEPEGRDTANAIALGAELIAARDPEATMAVFTADHIIRPRAQFEECVQRALNAAENSPEALVTFGVKPTWPHTGMGYIQCEEDLGDGVHRVGGFREKPDHRQARLYVESGHHFWNSGMFVWRVATIRQAVQRFLPESADKLAAVGEAARAGQDYGDLLAKVYPSLPKISIDFAAMEKAENVLMVELTAEWLDVGSWPALADVVTPDEDGNSVVATRAAVVDSERNIVYCEGNHLVAVLGVDECIVVHTPDATLVCKRSDAQRLKEMVEWIGEQFGSQYT
jgi:mannose-1-phosphate guanylyltransferase